MGKFTENAQDRDDEFARRLAGAAENIKAAMEDWLEEEVKLAIIELDMLMLKVDEGLLKQQLFGANEHLHDLLDHEITDAGNAIKDKARDVRNGAYDNVIDARMYLEEGICRMERAIRLVIPIRKLVEGFENPATDEVADSDENGEPEDEPEDNGADSGS